MRNPTHIKEGFTDDEIELIVKGIQNSRSYPANIVSEYLRKRDITLFLLACYTGLRPTEATSLEWNDIDFSDNKIIINPYTNKQRETLAAILTAKAKALLKQYREFQKKFIISAYLFPSINTFEPISSHYFEKRLRNIQKEIGLHQVGNVTTSGQQVSRKTFYSCRKYYGTKIYSRTKDVYAVMRALRQRKLESTTPYVLLSTDIIRTEIDKIL